MPNTCSIANCRTGYHATKKDSGTCGCCTQGDCHCQPFLCDCKARGCTCSCRVCKPKLFAFPRDSSECERWKKACPNVFSEEQKKFYACELHWPDDYETVAPDRNPHVCPRRPKHPPSVFNNIASSCFQQQPIKRRPTSKSSSEARNPPIDEMEAFNKQDIVVSLEDLKRRYSSHLEDVNCAAENESVCLYEGFIYKMHYCIVIFSDLSYKTYVRGVAVTNPLCHSSTLRFSRLEEVIRHAKSLYTSLDVSMTAFNDRQNVHILCKPNARRYNSEDISFALEIVSTSRAAYEKLRSYLALPTIRTMQNVFKGSEKAKLEDIFACLTPMQHNVFLNIDEVYVKPCLRFNAAQIYGYAADNTSELAKTVLVVMANCDYGGPKFVVSLKPVYRLTSTFQSQVVMEAVEKIESAGGKVFCCTFDGNAVNTKMAQEITKMAQEISGGEEPWVSVFNNHPIFWINDPVHILKCLRNNFLNAVKLVYRDPLTLETKTANWNDLISLEANERATSAVVSCSKLSKIAVAPPPIMRQRVDLALKVFCYETAAALQLAGHNETSDFVLLVAKFFTIMNAKYAGAGTRLRDELRQPISDINSPSIQFLRKFRVMINSLKPPQIQRRECDKTLTTATANATTRCIDGFCKLVEHLLDKGYSYVLIGRYTSDHIEKLFSKWRQSAGGNYYISVSEIVNHKRIQWAKVTNIFLDRPSASTSLHNCPMCHTEPTDIFTTELTTFTPDDNIYGAFVYIAGYLCHKFTSLPSIERENIDQSRCFDFLQILDRGGLKYPSPPVVSFVSLCHSAFISLTEEQTTCRNFCMQVFQVVNDVFDTQIEGEAVFRTVANIFMNNFCKTYNVDRSSKRKLDKLN